MSGVFGKVFGKSKQQSQATALASLDKLNEVNESIADILARVRLGCSAGNLCAIALCGD